MQPISTIAPICFAPARKAQVVPAQPTPANAPSRPVFVSRSFNCTMEPQNKAELTFFRAHRLAVAAPIKAPVNTQVAARPPLPLHQRVVAGSNSATGAVSARGRSARRSHSLTRWSRSQNRHASGADAPVPAPVPSSSASSQQPLLTGSFQPSSDSSSSAVRANGTSRTGKQPHTTATSCPPRGKSLSSTKSLAAKGSHASSRACFCPPGTDLCRRW